MQIFKIRIQIMCGACPADRFYEPVSKHSGLYGIAVNMFF